MATIPCPEFHEDFQIGQRVRIKHEHMPGMDPAWTGEIAGIATQPIFVVYIILLDVPITPPGYSTPWKAVCMPGQALEKI